MISASSIWLIVKTFLILLPTIVDAIKSGRIREGSQDEIANVLGGKFAARIDAAERARAEPDSMREPDPLDRANRG